jgi:ATP-dependent DNA helicase RecG
MCSTLRRLSQLSVDSIDTIAKTKIEALKRGGFESLVDLIEYFPRRYVDRRNHMTIAEAPLAQEVLVIATITAVESRYRAKGKEVIEAIVSDQSARLRLTFFNQPWRKHQLKIGTEAAIFGRIERFRNTSSMVNPLIDLVGDRTGRIVPIYPHSERFEFRSDEMPRFIRSALDCAGEICEALSPTLLEREALLDRNSAYRLIHFPDSMEDVESGRRRLAFDELLRLQLKLVRSKLEIEKQERGKVHDVTGVDRLSIVGGRSVNFNPSTHFQPNLEIDSSETIVERFFRTLSITPTTAQVRTIAEIARDMASKVPMHRLLQGDVGSGKTLVAICASLFAVQSGYQVAILAPTEVLAEQHFRSIGRMIDGLEVDEKRSDSVFFDKRRPVTIDFLAGKVTAARRRLLLEGLAGGGIDIVVGTHALLSEGVGFSDLGLIVIDEQHRFGVEQRSLLKERFSNDSEPDVLIMTATPIPRTAAMTLFGDLDVSVLDVMPPGRSAIVTKWARNEDELHRSFIRIEREVADGRQAYIVCPLVEESEKIAARSATEIYDELRHGRLKDLRLGLMHGQMSPAEKEAVMEDFRAKNIDVLVATTVIEVGVDVPNATVMMIMDAGRFGIAQIHQLRGRVGRGQHQSYCYLVETKEELMADTTERLEAICSTTNGFELAEMDLKLRGSGTITASRQKGRSDFRVASLLRDKNLLLKARKLALELLRSDLELRRYPLLEEEVADYLSDERGDFVFRN